MADQDDKGLESTPEEEAQDKTPENPILARLREIAAQNRPGAAEEEDRRKAKTANKGINLFHASAPEARLHGPIIKWMKKDLETKSRLEPRIRIKEEARQKTLTARAVNEVTREFSEETMGADIARQSTTPEAQLAATSMLGAPYEDLVGKQRAGMNRLKNIGTEQKELASDLILRKIDDTQKYPGMKEKSWEGMQANAGEADKIKSELANIAAALGQQKSQGLDPKSRMQDLLSKGEQAKDIVKNVELKKEIETGQGLGGMTTDELKSREAKAAEELVRALNELKTATDDQKKDKQEKAETAAADLDKVQSVIAAGGGGSKNRIDSFRSFADIAQSGFGAAANVVQQVDVNQRLAQAQNATGYADFENQKYQTYKAAAGGDIASLMQMSQFSAAEEFGGGVKSAANIAVGLQGAAGVVQAGVGAAEVATVENPIADLLNTGAQAQVVEAGAKNIMAGAATVDVAGHDLYRQVSGGQADLAARSARMDVGRAINAVGAEQVQGFRNFSVGMGTAAIGAGAGGEDLLNRTVSDSNLSRMAQARISPEQMAQMAQAGVAQQGSMFNENQVFTARSFEQRGLGTMQENMQRLGNLSAAGSNNPTASLGAITEAAVAKGLDSSKALNAVVDHTATMAASSMGRAIGLDTSVAAASLLTAGITKDTPNREAAIERAASVQDYAQTVGTNIGANYAGMVSIARTQARTGVGGIQAMKAESIDTQTLMAINDEKDPAKKTRLLQEAGINLAGNKDVNKAVEGMVEDRQKKMLEGGGRGLIFNNRDALLKRVNSAKTVDDLSGEDVTELADIAPAGMGAKDMFGMVKGVKEPLAKEAMGPQAPNDNTTFGKLDKQRTAGFEQLSTAAATGATALGGATKAVNALTSAFDGLMKSMPKIENEATTAAGKAAAGEKGMNMNISGFNDAIKKLNDVLDVAMRKANLGSVPATADNKKRLMPPGP